MSSFICMHMTHNCMWSLMRRMMTQAWHSWRSASVKWGHGQQVTSLNSMTARLNSMSLVLSTLTRSYMYHPSVLEMRLSRLFIHQGAFGAVLDDKLTMVAHVSSVCKSSYAHLHITAYIRRYLTQEATATLIHSLVMSWINKLNSLLVGLPDNIIGKWWHI